MSDITDDQPKAAATESESPHQASSPASPSDEAGDAPALSPAAALFRAFLRAGVDAELAYAAVEEAKMMAGENADAALTKLERLVSRQAK